MLQFLRDTYQTLQLKARYRRMVHERLVQLTESGTPQADADESQWRQVGEGDIGGQGTANRLHVRDRARQLVAKNPHARNILRLLEAYVTGPGFEMTHEFHDCEDNSPRDVELLQRANRLWKEFLTENRTHYSYGEHGRRSWRDGECFLRKFPSVSWPPAVRFIDPENIGPSPEHPESAGILTEPFDVETPVAYLRLEQTNGQLRERIDADEVIHTRIGVDSNQKRGMSIFASMIDTLDSYEQWLKTELLARKLQSSIVLWRKVQGSPQQTAAMADGQAGDLAGTTGGRREQIRPGTILTTNQATEIQFLQPQTNFGDAVPLGRMLLLATAAGAGLPEFMLTADASNSNFSSTMIAEGPAVKLFQSEQAFFAAEFTRVWRWVMSHAVSLGYLPDDFLEQITPRWSFPQLVSRDRPRERMADVQLVESRILSRAEIARRDGTDPARMVQEIRGEQAEPALSSGYVPKTVKVNTATRNTADE
ncbi:MAG: phage portal protein [Planctomycetaceae bacterium]